MDAKRTGALFFATGTLLATLGVAIASTVSFTSQHTDASGTGTGATTTSAADGHITTTSSTPSPHATSTTSSTISGVRAGSAVIDAAPVANTTTTAAGAMTTVAVAPFLPNLGPGESITVTPAQWPPLRPSIFPQAAHVGFHEFQVDCAVNHVAPDDPIVFPRWPGKSHSHTFVGATSTDAYSTTASLTASSTSCTTVDDHSAYWFPTMLQGPTCGAGSVSQPPPGCSVVLPEGHQIIYYKSGVKDYNSVRAFPRGLRFVIGSPTATAAQFQANSGSSGWSCGNSYDNWDLPAYCPPGSHLVVRYQAPSCWDGVHLDSADHRSHMAYPVNGVCPASHPVALPMLELKIAYPVSGDLTQVRLSSGRGYSWHADFFSAWSMPTQEALVTQCINGGGQCDARGFDAHKPERGSVLDANYQLLPGH